MTPVSVRIGENEIANGSPFAVIAGPCQIESLDHALFAADRIARACEAAGRRFIYKSSYDKANRSSHETARGETWQMLLDDRAAWAWTRGSRSSRRSRRASAVRC